MSEELFTPKQAEKIGAPKNIIAKAHASNRKVLRIVWDKEDGYPEHAWGYVQWSVRPFRQMDGYDGTIDDSVHLIGYRLCSQLGLDYATLMDEAYAWRDKDDNGDWVRETTEEQWQAIERNTIVPQLSAQSLRRLLYDLEDINYHSLVALLHDKFKAMVMTWMSTGRLNPMLIDQIPPTDYLPFLLIRVIGLNETAAKALIGEYGEFKVQEHALRCIWLSEHGRVHTPPAWLTASLKNDWQPARDMPSDLTPQVLTFRVDAGTFAQIEREMHEEKRTATADK